MMKIFTGVLTLCALFVNSASGQFTSATLQASGLTCAMCTKAIDNALKQVPFVASVKPDIKNSAFLLTFENSNNVNVDVLKKAVEDAGFFISKLKLTGAFNNVAIKNDEHILYSGKTYHFLNVNEQELTGTQTVTIVDKNFLSLKAFKKTSKFTSMECVQTGKAGSCCVKSGIEDGSRIYHVTL
jgi:copper chaperone CopZ